MQPRIRCALALGAAALLAAASASAETHLNQPLPERHVIVHFFGQVSGNICPDGGGLTLKAYRVLPSGKQVDFYIPYGFYFVVTDFDVSALMPNPPAGTSLELILRLFPASGSGGNPIVYRSSLALDSNLASHNFTITGQSLAGMMVGPGAALCPEFTLQDGSIGGERLTIGGGTYRGYFVPISKITLP